MKSNGPAKTAGKLSTGLVNLCTPCFAVSPKGRVTLVWSETKDGDHWVLKAAHFEPGEDGWPQSQTVLSEGNPRFPSAAYDSAGNLWIAYSVETSEGRELKVKKFSADK